MEEKLKLENSNTTSIVRTSIIVLAMPLLLQYPATNNSLFSNTSTCISISQKGFIHIEILRKERIKLLKGKYSFVKTSSEDFAIRKQKEIEFEK